MHSSARINTSPVQRAAGCFGSKAVQRLIARPHPSPLPEGEGAIPLLPRWLSYPIRFGNQVAISGSQNTAASSTMLMTT
jgi:hypothetical protein